MKSEILKPHDSKPSPAEKYMTLNIIRQSVPTTQHIRFYYVY